MNDIGKSDKPIVPAKRPNKGVGGNHVRRRARREGAIGQGKSAHTLQNLDAEPAWNCNKDGEDTQRLLCVITQGRSPVQQFCAPGSVRGAARKGRPYRDRMG